MIKRSKACVTKSFRFFRSSIIRRPPPARMMRNICLNILSKGGPKKKIQNPMPRRNDIKKILIVGAGPIFIGQGCEFDYSGTQACKALKEEGFEVVLVNSNPATIMTDPEFS